MITDEIQWQVAKNIQKWGLQDTTTLALAIAEESGEIAQAVLQAGDGGCGLTTVGRLRAEAIDLGALCMQMVMRCDEGRKARDE
jgi:NTP pyrophosphatase (non-canonical NTP hydrolase)